MFVFADGISKPQTKSVFFGMVDGARETRKIPAGITISEKYQASRQHSEEIQSFYFTYNSEQIATYKSV